MQALLGAPDHQDLVYPDEPHRPGAQLDAVLGACGVSVDKDTLSKPQRNLLSFPGSPSLSKPHKLSQKEPWPQSR